MLSGFNIESFFISQLIAHASAIMLTAISNHPFDAKKSLPS